MLNLYHQKISMRHQVPDWVITKERPDPEECSFNLFNAAGKKGSL